MTSKLPFLLIFCLSLKMAVGDWTKHCTPCVCSWVNGRKTANCTNKAFDQIPRNLSSEVRVINFSNNKLYSLGNNVFRDANLSDVHRLYFENCSLESLSEIAFSNLGLLIELDLSRNYLKTIHKDTFKPTIKLRILTLSHNNLTFLEEGLISNMTFLTTLKLDNNQIEYFNENTLQNLPQLANLDLSFNRIKTVLFNIKEKLPKLMSLNVQGNHWICDCRLQEFRASALSNQLITDSTECEEPPMLKGRLWEEESVQFACSPVVIINPPLASTQIEATSDNVTLTCKVEGEPLPDVEWLNNGYNVERDTKNRHKYVTARNQNGRYAWINLTITNLSYKDRGEYRCRAKNPGGQDEKNVTLVVSASAGGLIPGGAGGSIYWIIGLSVGLVVLLVITLVLVCMFCKRSSGGFNSRRRDLTDSSEECINMKGQLEIKKGLITDVNPVTKPPRATVPGSVVSGGTEVSDVKRNLLDNESVFDCDDESRSLDFDQPLLKKSQILLLESDYRLNNPYPPDLLPFPPRAAQVSPAGSSASTVADTTRLPPHHGPQSPLHSPIYDQMNLYRTLPYSRSHSPFVGTPVPRIPRQGAGYVTIPRRPRKSWSSEPPPAGENVPEPLYDNLGLRTTVDGSSALSINKLGTSESAASTPRSNRMFPLSPTTIDAIAEMQESSPPPGAQPPLAAPRSQTPSSMNQSSHHSPKGNHHSPKGNHHSPKGTHHSPKGNHQSSQASQLPPQTSQTLPRNLNFTANKLTPSRTQWAKDNAEALRSPSEKRDASLNTVGLPTTGQDKPTKIPPRPPPKPKKRISSGPLFEDEGEDGTEV